MSEMGDMDTCGFLSREIQADEVKMTEKLGIVKESDHDIDTSYEMPDDWGVIASGFQWVAYGKFTRKQRLIRWLRKLRR